MQYKKGRHIASKRNSVTVCGLPSIHLPLTREASLVRGKDSAKKAVTVGVVAAVKHSCITFNECRKLNIKNPLFTLMADFLCLWEFGGG